MKCRISIAISMVLIQSIHSMELETPTLHEKQILTSYIRALAQRHENSFKEALICFVTYDHTVHSYSGIVFDNEYSQIEWLSKPRPPYLLPSFTAKMHYDRFEQEYNTKELPIITKKLTQEAKTTYQGIVKQIRGYQLSCQITHDPTKKTYEGLLYESGSLYLGQETEILSATEAKEYYEKFILKEFKQPYIQEIIS